MVNIAILGASGRMGKELIQAIAKSSECSLVGAIVRNNSKHLGQDVGTFAQIEPMALFFTDSLQNVITKADVVLDFSNPEFTLENLDLCVEHHKKVLIGTSGFTDVQLAIIKNAAKSIPLMLAPNLSVGVNVMIKLVEEVAKIYGDSVDIEVIEAHHRHKIDAPSGTAMKLGQAAAKALGRDLEKEAVFGRVGEIGERHRNTIGFSTIRGGDIVGEHTVLFAGIGERLEITHRSSSRATFAKGALKAALWLNSKPKGFYDVKEALIQPAV